MSALYKSQNHGLGVGRRRKFGLIALSGLLLGLPTFASKVYAHCDTLDGPVVSDARVAISQGKLTPALKWIKPQFEAELKSAFTATLRARKSPESRELADRYFFETLVRLHREGEGAPYTGLKPAGTKIEPIISAADKAIQSGSVDKLANDMSHSLEAGVLRRFKEVRSRKAQADKSVASGREYVEAYVEFVHYVEELEKSINRGPASHGIH
jgi:hypothetical protein